jgi:hypothetical protein
MQQIWMHQTIAVVITKRFSNQLKKNQIGLMLNLTCFDHQAKCLCEAEETIVGCKVQMN